MRLQEYARMTARELADLERQKAVFLWPISPLEVHGPHLPLGTDVFIASVLAQRLAQRAAKERPDLVFIQLPPLYAGADPLPLRGSVPIPPNVLEAMVLAHARALSQQGFSTLLITDNHGGPRHQLALESASRKAYKRWKMHVIIPFNQIFRQMVEGDERLLQETGLAMGSCGDDSDSHAGTNETSLFLAAGGELSNYRQIPPASPPAPQPLVARLARAFAKHEWGRDLGHLANVLGWVGGADVSSYLGAPAKASRPQGEAMLNAHTERSWQLLQAALAGERVQTRPLLWSLRFLKHLPN